MTETTAALLDRMARTPREGHDEDWLDFVGNVLKLPLCYLPATQEVLEQGRWRRITGKGQNPIGYVKTATERQALRMDLALDRFTREPRLEAEAARMRKEKLVRLVIPEGTSAREDDFEKQQDGSAARDKMCDRPANSRIDAYNALMDGLSVDVGIDNPRQIPEWLQMAGEHDAVDWDKVAQDAAVKPRMVPAIANVLRLMASGWSRLRAIESASGRRSKKDIEAAWRWIDRNWDTKIVPLFRIDRVPTKTALPGGVGVRKSNSKVSSKLAGCTAAVALRMAIKNHRRPAEVLYGGPSLQQPKKGQLDAIRAAIREMGLQPAYVSWEFDNYIGRLSLVPWWGDRTDAYTIDGDDPDAVAAIMRASANEIRDYFAD